MIPMNTKTAITELSTRLDAFEERFDRLGNDVSAIAALFYSYIGNTQPTYVNVAGWQIPLPEWHPSDIGELVIANMKAWSDILGENSEEDVGGGGHNVGKETKSPQ
jgi:hypothetical protein